MQQHYAHLFPTPEGIMLAGIIIAKRNPDGSFAIKGREKHIHAMLQAAYGRPVSPKVIGNIERGSNWFVKASDEELRNAAHPFHPNPHVKPHSVNDVPVMAKALMEYALTGLNDIESLPEGRARLVKAQHTSQPDALMKSYGLPTWDDLAKDDGDDEDDEGDDGEDDSGSSASSSSDSGDDGGDSGGGGGHYNPDEPRIPAGQPSTGQWTTAGNGTTSDSGSISTDDVRNTPDSSPSSTREYQVADSGQIMTDANVDSGNFSDNKQSNAIGTLTQADDIPLANSKVLPYFDASIVDQIYSFFEDAEDQGIPVEMTSGFRTSDTQSQLTGNEYGGAAAGSSLHEAGFAFDINWNDLTADEQEQILDIAADNDLEWGGVFTIPDVVHFYVDPFKNFSARQAYISQAQQQLQTLQGKTK